MLTKKHFNENTLISLKSIKILLFIKPDELILTFIHTTKLNTFNNYSDIIVKLFKIF